MWSNASRVSTPTRSTTNATIEDPNVYTRPWTVSISMNRDQNYRIFEYACHEGNQAVENILRGGRAEDKAAEDATKSR